jgi:hypothetical protein
LLGLKRVFSAILAGMRGPISSRSRKATSLSGRPDRAMIILAVTVDELRKRRGRAAA